MTDDTRTADSGYDSTESLIVYDTNGEELVTFEGPEARSILRAAGGREQAGDFVRRVMKAEIGEKALEGLRP
jgi:hypothetical protein